MKKLVIYDSQYGNTGMIARAIAESLLAKAVSVSDAKKADLTDLDLLVIGSPTQGGRATEAMQKFISGLPENTIKKLKFAVFDTRFLESDLNFALKILVRIIGYAAPKMADILTKKGGKLIAPPEGFIVKGTKGPLKEGELKRARSWIKIP